MNVNHISYKDVKDAELQQIRSVQKDLPKDWKKQFQRLGPEINDDQVIVVGSRMSLWLKQSWNPITFVLLPRKAQFSELYLRSIHNEDHAGVEVTLAKSRLKFWIPQARKIIKGIKNSV